MLIGHERFDSASTFSILAELSKSGSIYLIGELLNLIEQHITKDLYAGFIGQIDWDFINEQLHGGKYSSCSSISNESIGRACAALLDQAEKRTEDNIFARNILNRADWITQYGGDPETAFHLANEQWHQEQKETCKQILRTRIVSNSDFTDVSGQPSGVSIFQESDKLMPFEIFKKPSKLNDVGEYRRAKSAAASECISEMLESGELHIGSSSGLAQFEFWPADGSNVSGNYGITREQATKALENTAQNQIVKRILRDVAKLPTKALSGVAALLVVFETTAIAKHSDFSDVREKEQRLKEIRDAIKIMDEQKDLLEHMEEDLKTGDSPKFEPSD